ncbi:hypothetical protein [Lentzea sp. NPDC092896]|uniref:hypothetical protein n=1 Tax=Lentzea sp. NPDC092896 TaxID=3364127 RepID=UPI0037F9F6A5
MPLTRVTVPAESAVGWPSNAQPPGHVVRAWRSSVIVLPSLVMGTTRGWQGFGAARFLLRGRTLPLALGLRSQVSAVTV